MNKLYFLLFSLIFPVLIFSQSTSVCAGVLDYEFYDLVPSGNTVDNIPTVEPTAIGEINNFDPFSIQNSITPEDNNTFSIRYSGYIEITVTGNYTFYTTSDDGSKLYIDGVQVVDNDGEHGREEKGSTKLNLSAGFHKIEVLFYENKGANILQVRYEGPSINKQLIPFSKLYNCHPNTPPKITASGNLIHCIGGSTPIVESVTIDDEQNRLNKIFIQITTNYDVGDLLSYDNSVSRITSSWNASEGKLTLTGPATLSEFEAAILAIRYSSTASLDDDTKDFSIVLAELNFLESTGHYYEYVPTLGITWTAAKIAAEDRNFYGVQGYLATITSADEAILLGEQAPGAGWIGANDAAVEGLWEWVTGPEAGQQFWQGAENGDSVNGMYANWNNYEPNNYSGNEDYAHINAPGTGFDGSWNDLPNAGGSESYQPKGYLVEYGGLNTGETFPQVSAVTKITPFTINNDNHPQNKTVFAGDNALFTVEAKNVGIYQWQVDKNDGDGFTNLNNGKEYSGVNTQELNILNVDINKEGYKYRVLLKSTKTTCSTIYSNEAILVVKVRTVITNRNQTCRVKKG